MNKYTILTICVTIIVLALLGVYIDDTPSEKIPNKSSKERLDSLKKEIDTKPVSRPKKTQDGTYRVEEVSIEKVPPLTLTCSEGILSMQINDTISIEEHYTAFIDQAYSMYNITLTARQIIEPLKVLLYVMTVEEAHIKVEDSTFNSDVFAKN